MNIKNLNEVIKNFEGDAIGQPTMYIDRMIQQIKLGTGTKESMIESLEDYKKENENSYTYGKVYEKSVLSNVEKMTAENFVKALELTEKIRKGEGENFTIDELKAIQDATAKFTINALQPFEVNLLKAKAIKNLNWEETKDKKSKDK